MNTQRFTGDMASQVEADRDQLVEMREVLAWASDNLEWCDTMGHWECRGLDGKRHRASTLYAALHAAWSNRGKT